MARPDFEPPKYREQQPPAPKTIEERIADELGGKMGETILRDVEVFRRDPGSDRGAVTVAVYTRLPEKVVTKAIDGGKTIEIHHDTVPLRRAVVVQDEVVGINVLVDRPGDGPDLVFATAAGNEQARGRRIDDKLRPWKALTNAARGAWIFSAGTAAIVSGFMAGSEKPGFALTAAAIGAAVAAPSGAVDFATSRFTRARRIRADAYARRSEAVQKKKAMVLPK